MTVAKQGNDVRDENGHLVRELHGITLAQIVTCLKDGGDLSRIPNLAYFEDKVLKITNVKPALTPPKVETSGAKFDRGTGTATLTGRLIDMGNAAALDVGFEYRSIVGLDASDRSIAWQPGPSMWMTAPGTFTLSVPGLNPDGIYEYRAWVKHPLLKISGVEKPLPMN